MCNLWSPRADMVRNLINHQDKLLICPDDLLIHPDDLIIFPDKLINRPHCAARGSVVIHQQGHAASKTA